MNKTILLVDDDIEQRDVYTILFKQAGFNTIVAGDGLQAYDLSLVNPPDLVFTGVIMPKMDGFELVQQLRKQVTTANIPIIMFSHLGREEDRKKASAIPKVHFMIKGYNTPKEILNKVKELLNQP